MVGERWARNQREVAEMLGPFVAPLVTKLNPQPGDRLIDIGCGSGDVCLVLADHVGATGRVLGVDISKPMLEIAVARTKHLAHITLIEADAASSTLPDAPYDGAVSRFGVMFFADPGAAFAQIRSNLRPGAPLIFVCWQSFEHNPWAYAPYQAIADLLPVTPPSDPLAPGPFAFADRDRLAGLLTTAGYHDVSIDSFEATLPFAAGAGLEGATNLCLRIGPAARAMADLDDAARTTAIARLRECLADHVVDDVVQLQGAVWLVQAVA